MAKEEPILEKRIRPVRTVTVTETPQDIYRRFAGGSQAAISSKLSFRTTGQIIQLPVKVGQKVERGQLIAKLNDSDLKIKLERDEASYRQANVQTINSKNQFIRMQNIYDRQLISRAEFDNSQTEYQAAQAQLDQVASSVALSRQELGYTRLSSPGDGCEVSEIHAEVNENVTLGQEVVTLNCGTTIEVVVAVPESLITSIVIGNEATVNFPSLKKRSFEATITEIGSASTSKSAYPVTVRMSNNEQILRPGMAAEVSFRVSIAGASKNLWAPLIAIGKEGLQRFVFIYEPIDETQGLVKKRFIQTGDFTLEEVEVLEGLQKGDQLITAGLSQIYDGLTVKRLLETKAGK